MLYWYAMKMLHSGWDNVFVVVHSPASQCYRLEFFSLPLETGKHDVVLFVSYVLTH